MSDVIIGNVLKIEVALYHAYFRLEANTDGEALHDLRIQLRRLRSLLRPLRGIESVKQLDSAAAQIGSLTTAVRDLEVLIGELENKGYGELAASRRETLARAYGRVLRSRALAKLLAELDKWPGSFRQEWIAGDARKLSKKVTKWMERQVNRLAEVLSDPGIDPHKLRILVKHTRYMIDAYPQRSTVNPEVICSLKSVQSALGAWHDLYQWCHRADSESDLQPLQHEWQLEAATALSDAKTEIIHLKQLINVRNSILPPLPRRVGEFPTL